MPIKILDPRVISQIAAGEVVERPSSVVKELVENSLDAGSTQITVEVKGGGIALIRVTDNGTGIPAEEAEVAFQRHATSKISSLEDLEKISSLGFRGEALPSIAAVAQVEMITSAAGESAGTGLLLEDGRIIKKTRQGRPQGTTISVSQLFRKVPARLKFLKSESTENSRIADVVTRYALAYPEVKFTLIADGRSNLRTPGSGQMLDSIVAVYGAEVAREMLPVDTRQSGLFSFPVVSGMVSSPRTSRSNRDYLTFLVNRRLVNSRMLTWAVEEAYHGLLMQERHPIAVINISLPAPELDVNIHPAKIEVRFQNERAVFGAVQKAIRRVLVEQSPVPQIEESPINFTTLSGSLTARPWTRMKVPLPAPPSPADRPSLIPQQALPVLRVMGQFARSYIVAEGPDGLYLIDQHAAHERIMFERIQEQKASQKIEVQGLLEPAALEVDPRQSAVLQAHITDLGSFGFAMEPFGEKTYLVRHIPALLQGKDWMAALRDSLDSLYSTDWAENMMMSLACHSAVRAGKVLTDQEMRELVQQLEKASIPQTCPHGRPTMIHLSQARLEKEFKRT